MRGNYPNSTIIYALNKHSTEPHQQPGEATRRNDETTKPADETTKPDGRRTEGEQERRSGKPQINVAVAGKL
jgi:hypothetical protein